MQVIATLVDSNDNVIGSKDRAELKPGDIYRVAALWLVNSKHQTLLAQRLLTKKNDPGKWGPAASGTVEINESYEQNIAKESAEELGLTGVSFAPVNKIYVADNGHGQGFFCQTFLATCDWPVEQFKPQPDEVAAVKWVDIDELRQQVDESPEMFTMSFASAFERLVQSLDK